MRIRRTVASLAAAAALAVPGTIALDVAPASAAAVCTSATTGGEWTRINGAIRKATGIGTSWSTGTKNGCYVYFPPGGNLYLKRLPFRTPAPAATRT